MSEVTCNSVCRYVICSVRKLILLFFIIDAYTTNALKFTLILKKNTYSCIVYGHQEIFVKGFEENLYKNISFDNTPKNCIYKARPCEIMHSFRDFICFQPNHTIIKTFPNFPKGWKTCLSNYFYLFISSAWNSSCFYFFFFTSKDMPVVLIYVLHHHRFFIDLYVVMMVNSSTRERM